MFLFFRLATIPASFIYLLASIVERSLFYLHFSDVVITVLQKFDCVDPAPTLTKVEDGQKVAVSEDHERR